MKSMPVLLNVPKIGQRVALVRDYSVPNGYGDVSIPPGATGEVVIVRLDNDPFILVRLDKRQPSHIVEYVQRFVDTIGCIDDDNNCIISFYDGHCFAMNGKVQHPLVEFHMSVQFIDE